MPEFARPDTARSRESHIFPFKQLVTARILTFSKQCHVILQHKRAPKPRPQLCRPSCQASCSNKISQTVINWQYLEEKEVISSYSSSWQSPPRFSKHLSSISLPSSSQHWAPLGFEANSFSPAGSAGLACHIYCLLKQCGESVHWRLLSYSHLLWCLQRAHGYRNPRGGCSTSHPKQRALVQLWLNLRRAERNAVSFYFKMQSALVREIRMLPQPPPTFQHQFCKRWQRQTVEMPFLPLPLPNQQPQPAPCMVTTVTILKPAQQCWLGSLQLLSSSRFSTWFGLQFLELAPWCPWL